jgi:hypothetical protein
MRFWAKSAPGITLPGENNRDSSEYIMNLKIITNEILEIHIHFINYLCLCYSQGIKCPGSIKNKKSGTKEKE